ncbi:hypothetical protein CsatB_016761 [Cannabis sativa]
MNEISKLMDQGKRVALEVNDKGQYCGKSYAKLVSTLGVRCRQTIGLAYKNWKEVNQTLKNQVWKDIQTGFIVPDTFKHDCLILAGKLMKDFKNRMTKDIIMPALKENDLGRLAQVPEKHPEIDAADWCKFVESRLTPEFLELSKVQRERSSKIQSRHRSGRSGMVNVREAVKKDLEVADPPRHRVWIKSRTKSRKLVTDYDKEIAEKIAQLEEKLSQGQIQVQGQNDILTQALGTPEHPGRVRAAGYAITSNRNAAEQEEEGEVAGEAYVPQPYAPQDEVQPQIYAEEFISLNDQGILYNFDDQAALTQQVHLCSDNIDNIVARGYLYEHVGVVKVHCQDYDDSHARIMVSEILQEDAEIPVPLEEFRYVRDVYQMFLPWPKHLILTTEGPLAQPPSRRDASKGKAPMLSPQSRGAREDELFTEEKMALIPNSLKWMIHEFLRLKDKRDIITIPVPRGFIAPRTQITLSGEDLQQVATLHGISDEEQSQSFDDAARRLANWLSLMNSNHQMFFIPWNIGMHWTLVVVAPKKIIHLNPLKGRPIPEEIEQMIGRAFMYIGDAHQYLGPWQGIAQANCPRQPKSQECGFYVLKYMTDIVARANPNRYIEDQKAFGGKKQYDPKTEILPLQRKWIEQLMAVIHGDD